MPSGDFDFIAANTRFNKEEHRNAQDEAPVAYNKLKSFFDDISCETKEGHHSLQQHPREDRRVNLETFGQTNLDPPSTTQEGVDGAATAAATAVVLPPDNAHINECTFINKPCERSVA